MRRIVDFSDYQSGLDVDTVAKATDAAWAKCGDWGWVSAYGWPGDDVHDYAIKRFTELGVPIGTYFFPRPGRTSPQTQIDAWRAHAPAGLMVKPMLDLEVPGSLSGSSLTDWVTEALYWTADRFEVDLPVLYWSYAFQQGHGMGLPSTPHIPMVAEYHRGYSPFYWADLPNWESRAYSAYGGPDVPAGYGFGSRDLIWQFTSSAQLPGFLGLVDCSFVPDALWPQLVSSDTLGGSSFTPPSATDDFWSALMADPRVDQLFSMLDGIYAATAKWNDPVLGHPPAIVDATIAGRNATDAANGARSDIAGLATTLNSISARLVGLQPSQGGPVDTAALAQAVVALLGQALSGESLGHADAPSLRALTREAPTTGDRDEALAAKAALAEEQRALDDAKVKPDPDTSGRVNPPAPPA